MCTQSQFCKICAMLTDYVAKACVTPNDLSPTINVKIGEKTGEKIGGKNPPLLFLVVGQK